MDQINMLCKEYGINSGIYFDRNVIKFMSNIDNHCKQGFEETHRYIDFKPYS